MLIYQRVTDFDKLYLLGCCVFQCKKYVDHPWDGNDPHGDAETDILNIWIYNYIDYMDTHTHIYMCIYIYLIYCMNWITISSTWCELLWIRRRLAVRGCSTVPVTLVRWTPYAGHCRRSPGSRRSHRTPWGLERGVRHMGITICHFHIISIITYINYHLFLQVYAEYCAYVFLAIGFIYIYIYIYIYITIILATHTCEVMKDSFLSWMQSLITSW